MTHRTDTFRFAMAGPADLSGLTALIEDGALDPTEIVAILVKTEGNGGVNDFTREYTCTTIATTLAPYLRATNAEVERRIAMVVSGGTEGVLSPHATIFARVPIMIDSSKWEVIEAGHRDRGDDHRDRKSTRLNSSHLKLSRMPSSA